MRNLIPAVLSLAVLGAGAVGLGEERVMPPSDVSTRLATVKDRGSGRITTRGRKTGKPHTVTIWFVTEGPTVYLSTLNVKRDWVRNLAQNPDVVLDLGDLRVRGRATAVTDPALDAHVRDLLASKYWMAWIGSWFGKGPERTFRVDGVEPA